MDPPTPLPPQEPAPAAVGYTAQRLHNAAHDEAIEARRDDEFEFDEDEESVPTPIVASACLSFQLRTPPPLWGWMGQGLGMGFGAIR